MGIIYVAPLKKGIFLDDMLRTLRNGHHMEFRGAVVVHGSGPWDRQIWESSPANPSGKKLGELNGIRFTLEARDAMKDNDLVLYAERHEESVLRALKGHGYSPVRLAYESDQP